MGRHVIGRVADLPEGGRLLVELQGRSIGVFHVNGRFHALLNRCPHMGAELCRGSVLGHLTASRPGVYDYDAGRALVRCPWHGWEYDLATGQSYFDSRVRPYPVDVLTGEAVAPQVSAGEATPLAADAAAQIASGLGAPQLRPGPYVAERFGVEVSGDYLVVTMPGGPGRRAPASLHDVVVTARDRLADDVVALTLERAGEGADGLPDWAPGAHVGLLLADGLERQYSLCGDPSGADRTWRVAVLREPAGRGGSRHVHERLRVGDTLAARGPRNAFELVDAPAYHFIAGGIGVTPLRAMVAALQVRGAPWRMVYGGRRRASMAFCSELEALGAGIWPQDERGLIDLAGFVAGVGTGEAVYCCGPEPLLRATEAACADLAPGTLHTERFHPEPIGPGADRPFEVALAASGQTVAVAAGETIVQALEAAGVSVASSCREGTCGTCETGLLDGEADHRDAFLSAQERAAQDTVMICCSRARGERLVLDL